MNDVTDDVIYDFKIWLLSRESDVAIGMEDFGELQEIFFQLIGRNAAVMKDKE